MAWAMFLLIIVKFAPESKRALTETMLPVLGFMAKQSAVPQRPAYFVATDQTCADRTLLSGNCCGGQIKERTGQELSLAFKLVAFVVLDKQTVNGPA